MCANARTMPPGKITSAKPIDSSSAADSGGVLPPSTILASSGTPPSAGGMRLSSTRVLGASTKSTSAPASRYSATGARLAVSRVALDGAFKTFDRNRVGARDHQRLARAPRIERRLDLASHLDRRDEDLAVEVAAALRKCLVLELNGARPRAFEQAHGAPDVERVAIAGVGVNDQIGVDAIADHGDNLDNLAHAHETDVRSAEPRIRDRCAGDVQRPETALFGDQRGERVVDAGSDHDGLAHEARPQLHHVSHSL